MIKMMKIVVLTLLVAACAVSPVAAGSSNDSTTYSIYRGGVSALEQTEGLISGVLKSTFSLFNPCLDIVKGCTNIVLAPIEYPFRYFAAYGSRKQMAKKRSIVSATKKSKNPKK